MSYSEPRYHGDRGEVSAVYRPADQGPDLSYPSGNTVHYLATGACHRWLLRRLPHLPDESEPPLVWPGQVP